MDERAFRLGTRGSSLARRQAGIVEQALTDHRFDVELVEVTTEGDRIQDDLIHRLGKTGAFVRDLDDRVLSGELDAAVHSLKDMPTEMPDGLVVAAIPERKRPHDVLVTPNGGSVEDLPSTATVGTGSLRRRAQLGRQRDDITVEPIRGNVDTRIEKLLGPHLTEERESLEEAEREEWEADLSEIQHRALKRETSTRFDALVLAGAGLERASLIDQVETAPLRIDHFVPAAGQGAIAVTMRDNEHAEQIHRFLDHPPSRVAATVERTILSGLGGGCIAPIGINAIVQGDIVRTRVQVLSSSGEHAVQASRDLPIESYLEASNDLVDHLADEGAVDLIEAAAKNGTEPA